MQQETAPTQVELEKMRARLQELVAKDELTPEELKEFTYLLWDQDGGTEFGTYSQEDMGFPEDKPLVEIYVGEPSDNSACVTLLDGVTDYSGEQFRLREIDGQMKWCAGIYESYYSKFLEREVLLDTSEGQRVFRSEESLSPQQCAKLAKTVYKIYQESQK